MNFNFASFHVAHRGSIPASAALELIYLSSLLKMPHVCVLTFVFGMQDCEIHSGHEERERGNLLPFSPEDVE